MKAKKLIGLLLAASLVMGMAGCGQQSENKESTPASAEKSSEASEEKPAESSSEAVEEKEPVTLTWWYAGNGVQKDTQAVNDYLNEQLQEIEGMEHVTIELYPILQSEYKTQVTLGLSSGAKMDILNVSYMYPLDTVISEGTVMPLDEYMDQVPGIEETLPEWLMNYGKANGKQYMIPNYQQSGNISYSVIPQEYIDKGYITDEDFHKMSSSETPVEERLQMMEDYLLAVRAGENSDTKYISCGPSGDLKGHFWADYFAGKFAIEEGSTEVFYQPLCDTFKTLAAKQAEWYEKGYAYPEEVEDTVMNKQSMLNDVSEILSGNHDCMTEEYSEAMHTADYGFPVAVAYSQDHVFSVYSWAAGGQVLPKNCSAPEEAMRFIELMTTEEGKDLYNTVVYGLEGVHYEWVDKDNNQIKTLEYDGPQASGTSYSAHRWLVGNTFNVYYNQACSAEKMDAYLKANEEATGSLIAGIVFDMTPVQSQIDQVAAVYGEYENTFKKGYAGEDFDQIWAEFENKLKVAGVDDVIAELQKQVDAHVAANK